MRKRELVNNKINRKEERRIMRKLKELHNNQEGFDLIVSIMVLAVMVGIAILFRTQITAFVNSLFETILAF